MPKRISRIATEVKKVGRSFKGLLSAPAYQLVQNFSHIQYNSSNLQISWLHHYVGQAVPDV